MRIRLHKERLKKQSHILYVPRIISQPYQTSQNFSSIQFIILLIKINPHRYLNAACFHFLTAQEKVSSFWITNCVVWLCSVETNSHLFGIVGFTALGRTMAKLVSTLLIDTACLKLAAMHLCGCITYVHIQIPSIFSLCSQRVTRRLHLEIQ